MSAIRFRPNNACSAVLDDIPGGTAFVKTRSNNRPPFSASPVQWLGFICRVGARRLPWGRPGKLVAVGVTNGDAVSSDWRKLSKDEYVVCVIVPVGKNNEFGAFAVVDRDGWPMVRSDTGPRLTIVQPPVVGKVAEFKKRSAQ